jgi:very-short-patch-repair endonuclease
METAPRRLGFEGHVWMTYEATAMGYDDKAIARLVRCGDWHRLRHGAYCSGEVWASSNAAERRLLLTRAGYRAARAHVVVSHSSAADLLGVPVWDLPDTVHLTRTDGRAGRRGAGKVPHRGLVTVMDVTRRDGLWTVNGTRAALDCTLISDIEHSLVIVNGLLHVRETTKAMLRYRLTTMNQWPDSLHTGVVIALADKRCESVGETRTLYLCWAQHLPRPVPQCKIKDRSGRVVARVDFAWPRHRVFLEFDGKEKYLKHRRPGESVADAVLREKRREERICELTGWRCIRIIWADLYHPERTAARIREVMALAERAA